MEGAYLTERARPNWEHPWREASRRQMGKRVLRWRAASGGCGMHRLHGVHVMERGSMLTAGSPGAARPDGHHCRKLCRPGRRHGPRGGVRDRVGEPNGAC